MQQYHWYVQKLSFCFVFVTAESLSSSDRLTMDNLYDPDMKLSGVRYVIGTAVLADTGVYECQASNAYGSATKQITIDVMAGRPAGEVSV